MYVIKNGKKLNQAWRYFICKKCGQEFIELKRDAVSSFERVKFSEEVLESNIKRTCDEDEYVIRSCGNCGSEVRQSFLTNEIYRCTFTDIPIPSELGGIIHLKEDYLFY